MNGNFETEPTFEFVHHNDAELTEAPLLVGVYCIMCTTQFVSHQVTERRLGLALCGKVGHLILFSYVFVMNEHNLRGETVQSLALGLN